MVNLEYIYFPLLGLCNFIIFRECFSLGIVEAIKQNLSNPRIRGAALFGIVVTLAGGLAHSKAGFNPEWTNIRNWLSAIGLPIILAFVFKSASDPGSRMLYQGKSSWRRLPIQFTNGEINSEASSFRNHPNISSAKGFFQDAITYAAQSQSKINPLEAKINEAIAHHELGLMYRVVNSLHEAKSAYDMSLSVLNSISAPSNNKRYLSARRDTLFRLAELHLVMGDAKQAKKYCDDSDRVDSLLGHNDPIGKIAAKQLQDEISKRL